MFKIKETFILFSLIFTLQACGGKEDEVTPPPPPPPVVEANVDFYLTTPDQVNLLKKTTVGVSSDTNTNFTINVSEGTTYQEMDGFGYTLTGGSAMLINNMSSSARASLLQELFGSAESSIGVSYLRISIGASDLDVKTFSYNDLPSGQTDENLNNFSLNQDKINLIPVLKEILAINPDIKILATPWSAPTWMKTNNNTVGGQLLEKYYGTYANYFVKYIRGMASEGISIDAITVQNEPENPYNNPSMVMNAEQQKVFIRDYLGPLFSTENISTKIILFDHNLDNPDYPISIMDDAVAKSFVDGSAFHLYAGEISTLSSVKNAHPDKNVYFTEQWMQAPGNFYGDMPWHIRELTVGATRNWSKTVLEWNLASDPNSGPHTNGGCEECLGAITIDGNNVVRNPAYYTVAHSSKFVPPGSVRIQSNYSSEFPNVAYKTPDDKIVVIVLNDSDVQKALNINVRSEPVSVTMPSRGVATFVW
ncbi:glycoside hydrolase family 30 beta sandwich domain-containing protein [Tenacibaculum tangerinum]|uniref:Glycoside hydrolase family 30 beta sandwich domain-containing protein n=1 Tax=Tenacibaculum tangerinum TaxID=3038772 RepID=A0ABY8L6B1_9FLAO|nr:glycoside hydrolase family 30 beta sandwich domain-containing protein [Tenacibaculum tangerinum]WGH76932.1 glycoside hydrolase family 30 beta sandwich domain-containing protein [Tenacibaculum tangerinum]